jgi:hypothetical protein
MSNPGGGDIYSIGRKWAPVSDPRNGIAGMDNGEWPRGVTEIYRTIEKEAR